MFFLVISANLAVYLSSFQLLGSGSAVMGGLALAGGFMMTSLSALFYTWKANHTHHQEKKSKYKKWKIFKKLIPDCDCDCPNCGCD